MSRRTVALWQGYIKILWQKYPGQQPEVGWDDEEYLHIYSSAEIREFCRLLLLACDEAEQPAAAPSAASGTATQERQGLAESARGE